MNKKIFIFIFAYVAVINLNAQNCIGIDYYKIGDYDLARKYLEANISLNSAETYYYLGEVSFAQGNTEDARAFYSKGLNCDKEYLFNKIGLLKIDLKMNSKEALSSIVGFQNKYNDDIDVLIAIGYAYLDNGLTNEATNILNNLMKLDKKNPNAYIFEGDILRSYQKYGESAAKYDMAIYFDPSCVLGYLKGAKIYEYSNWQTSVGKLEEIIKLQPDYILAYRYLGKIYTSNGYYSKAIDAFKIFFASGYYTLDDITRYVTALYFNNQYEDANKLLKEGLAINHHDFVLNRLQMYVASDLQNYDEGLVYAKDFFSLTLQKDDKYLAKDYQIYAGMLKNEKMYDQAFSEYQKAISLDSNFLDLYKEMASLMSNKGENGYAANLYQQYITKVGDKVEAIDFFQLGKYFYNAGNVRSKADTVRILNLQSQKSFLKNLSTNELQEDSLSKDSKLFIGKAVKYYLDQANFSFDTVINLIPAGYTGYLWKARTNSLFDPESELGLAKPYYEKTIEILLGKTESNKSSKDALIEAYSYLGYYYYLKEDKENTLIFWNKVLQLDPNNANAKTVLKTIK